MKKYILITIISILFLITPVYAEEKVLVNIDYPILNEEKIDSVKIQGWVLSTTNTKLKAFIDNTEIEVDRENRPDVLNAIKDYGDISTNPTPGFRKEIDIDNLPYGSHTLKIDVLDQNDIKIQSMTRVFIKKTPKTLINIDYPKVNEEKTSTLKIQGWTMSIATNTIKVSIDNTEVEVDRNNRPDVLEAIKDYGDISTNPQAGFTKTIDIDNLSYGEHTLIIDAYDKNNNKIETSTRTFIKATPKTLINIDYPRVNEEKNNILKIQGWIMSTATNTIKVYVDDTEVEVDRNNRPDVINAIKDYGDISTNPTPGFRKEIDIENLPYGEHILKIDVYDKKNNKIQTSKRTFIKATPKTLINIDYPKVNEEKNNSLKIQGWIMSTTTNTIKVYVDNTEVEVDRNNRPDVLKAITGYGDISTNPQAGFTKTIDIENLPYGEHILKIDVYDKNSNKIQTTTRKFFKAKPKFLINIDYPRTKEIGTTINIQGWYLVNSSKVKPEILLDGNIIEYNNYVERPDVYKVYNNKYGKETLKPGFDLSYDVEQLNDGKHTITIRLISTTNNELISSKTQTFNLKKVNGTIFVDHLEQSSSRVGYILDGWEMSTKDESYLKVYVDNNIVETDIERSPRPDVINAIKDYGTQTDNSKPGYNTFININNINKGKHIVKIELYSKYNELITKVELNINIYSKEYTNNKLNYNIPYYSQYDYRWKDIQYGMSKFGPRGCAPTSMAMAFSSIKGIEILPNEIADYLYYNTREFNKDTKGTSGLGIIYATNKYNIKRIGISSKEDLDRELQAGRIVFAAMGPGIYGTRFWNHAILLKGYSNGSTYSYDPLDTKKNIWVSTTTIWNERSKDPDDYRGGFVFYSLSSNY